MVQRKAGRIVRKHGFGLDLCTGYKKPHFSRLVEGG
jgi:hypothetical protein